LLLATILKKTSLKIEKLISPLSPTQFMSRLPCTGHIIAFAEEFPFALTKHYLLQTGPGDLKLSFPAAT
jgi:hypothetical protein